MKISKLFHWLYAIIMLLPIFGIGVTCAYVIFNKNAYQSYSGNDYSTYDAITNINQIELNKKYHFNNYGSFSDSSTKNSGLIGYSNLENVNIQDTTLKDYLEEGSYFRFYYSSNPISMYVFDESNTQIGSRSVSNYSVNFDFTMTLYEPEALSNNITFLTKFNNNSYGSIDNVFYYSIDKVEQSPLFSWSYDSFLATPITYISDLFGISSNSPVILLMSYWLAISIIWLVFDLVMYMPLLVHRWLDKGVLE